MKKMLIGIGIVIFFLIIPVDNIKFNTYETSVNKVAYDETFPSIAHGNTVSQQFVPQYNCIKKMEICLREVKGDSSQGYLQFCILDSKKKYVYEEKIPLTEMASPGWYTIFSDIFQDLTINYFAYSRRKKQSVFVHLSQNSLFFTFFLVN